MFKLNLNIFKNSRILVTNKFIIFITKNGILKFNTNFFNLIAHCNCPERAKYYFYILIYIKLKI